jgi:hypothetical protein
MVEQGANDVNTEIFMPRLEKVLGAVMTRFRVVGHINVDS